MNMCYEDETEDYYDMLDKQSEEDELISFIVALVEYSAELEEQVVDLRRSYLNYRIRNGPHSRI